MRAFLAACIAAIILAVCGVLALGAVQRASGSAFSTEGVRIDPNWSWRQMFRRSASNPAAPRAQSGPDMSGTMAHVGPEGCEETSAYRWIFVDFGESNENDACAVSQ
jgi:Tfp pilus assembly protein PilV